MEREKNIKENFFFKSSLFVASFLILIEIFNLLISEGILPFKKLTD